VPSPLRTLVAAQLKLDLRHPRTGRARASRLVMTAVAYGFSGLVLALSLSGLTPEEALRVAGSFGLVFAAFGVVGSYEELMGRPKENAWLMTLPASEGQHYGARLVAIALHFVLMALAVAAPVAARVAWAHGIGAALSVGALVAAGMLWTAAASLAVFWALTLGLPPRVLRPVLGVARALLVALLVLGYQWIGSQEGAGADAPWWPAAWLADLLSGRSTLGLAALLGSTGLLVGAFAGFFPSRYFRVLTRVAGSGRRADGRPRAPRALTGIERALVRQPAPRAAYGFACAAFRSDRLVRGRLWPAAFLPLGFALFGWWMGGLGDLFVLGSENVLEDEALRLHLSLLVVLLFAGHNLVQTLQFSDHAEGAWVFGTLPGAASRALQVGAQQALTYRVLLPLHVLLAVTLWTRMPLGHALLHAGFWFAMTALATRLLALAHRRPPFARRADRFNAAERLAPLLLAVPAGLVVALLQTFTFTRPLLALQAIVGLLLVNAAVAHLAARPRLGPRVRPPVPAAPVAAEAV